MTLIKKYPKITQRKNKVNNSFVAAGPYLGLGLSLAATIVLMLFLGKFIDEKLGTLPIFTLVFAFFGGFAGVYNLIKTVLKMNKRDGNEKDD